jgi:hypothetical protein
MLTGFHFPVPFGSDPRYVHLILRGNAAGQLAQSGRVPDGYSCLATGLSEAAQRWTAGEAGAARLVQSYQRLITHYSQMYGFPGA